MLRKLTGTTAGTMRPGLSTGPGNNKTTSEEEEEEENEEEEEERPGRAGLQQEPKPNGSCRNLSERARAAKPRGGRGCC